MIALIRWIVSLVVLAMWCALIGTGLYVAMYEPPAEMPEGAAIIVLGGGLEPDGTLTPLSAQRLSFAVELYNDGAAPLMVFTGGGPIAEAAVMGEGARTAGVPDSAILRETASTSTLQNALFTADIAAVDKTVPVLLVSQRFHLPRAWASFRWAGFQDITLVAADPAGGLSLDVNILMEAVKWPLNAFRAAAASAAMAGEVPREDWVQYLR